MSKRDYYDVLGAGKASSDAELKKAYRKQAMKFHPDRNPDDAKAEHNFKEVGEAYEALKDPQKRAAYDKFGHAAFENGGGGRGGHGGAGGFGGGFGGSQGGFDSSHFADMFGDIFGGGGQSQGGHGQQQQRGSDLQYRMSIGFNDAYNGKTTEVTIPTLVACGGCHGSGAGKNSSKMTCGTCGGQGQVRMSQGFFNMVQECPHCDGKGQMIKNPCGKCHGTGQESKRKTISITIPKGVENGMKIRLSGEGEVGENGAPAGDLYIVIQVKGHKVFQREGDDLLLDVPIDFVEASLGGEVEVPTPDGKTAKLKIPEGTQAGQRFRMRGKGMPHVHSAKYGDMYVDIHVETPSKLSKKQKEILRSFRNESSHKNYPAWDKIAKFFKAS